MPNIYPENLRVAIQQIRDILPRPLMLQSNVDAELKYIETNGIREGVDVYVRIGSDASLSASANISFSKKEVRVSWPTSYFKVQDANVMKVLIDEIVTFATMAQSIIDSLKY